jgi:hypothetical protein
MKTKIVSILVITLLIATALPAVGTMNELEDEKSISMVIKNQEVAKLNMNPFHDPVIDWERLYGGANEDVFRYVKQTSDGGYITVGVWNSTSHWLVKLDEDGNVEWDTHVLPNATHWPRCFMVEQTSDGGFVTAGSHELGTWGYNRCIWKVDSSGNTDWLKIYDDPGYHTCIQETDDGGYIVTGEIDIAPRDWDVLLMKTDSVGTVEWQKIFRFGEYGDNAYAIRQTDDGGYILAGRVETSFSGVEADFLVIKTDSNGNMEWNKTYGGAKWEWTQSNDILFTDDGGYIFLGETDSFGAGSRDIWLFKTDASGNMEWNKTFGGPKHEMGGGLAFTDDGGLIITGTYDAFGFTSPKSEGLVIKTDENGNLEWQMLFGDEELNQIQGVCTTSDGGCIVAGIFDSTDSYGSGLMDGWLIKMQDFENNPPDKPDKPSGKSQVDAGKTYTYKVSTIDSDGDQVYFMWDWGDGNFSEWLGPYDSGEESETENYWEEGGKYSIKVKAKDEHGAECEWCTPKSKPIIYNFPMLNWLFERFPSLFPILRQMVGN